MKSHSLLVDFSGSVTFEAGNLGSRAINKSRIAVSHALQLALDLHAHRALQPNHMVLIAVSTLVTLL